MEEKKPHFVCYVRANVNRVTFVTFDIYGNKQEISLWDLMNLHGSDKVLEMKKIYPEIRKEE